MTVSDVGAAYDAWSREYVERFGSPDNLAPEDRALVSRWRDSTQGLLLDAGCGPGQWVDVLHEGGRDVLGVDLSERFLSNARSNHPEVPFLQGSLTALPLRADTVGGILAWYSIIHTAPDALTAILGEFDRVLRPDGSIVLAFVDGTARESFAHTVITAYRWSVDALASLLEEARFEVVEHQRRQDRDQRPHAALIARRTPG